ncbi:MAG: hypothetical protein A4E56_03321 [Pelotomaculum sp. PtaU1.Bin065]|nr:MAG: hypothetical protein A4E56_03321 [Pelotomaculum sp. PtaU1.Bin065]
MFCKSCGKMISNNTSFCSHCGIQVGSQAFEEEKDAKPSTTGRYGFWRLVPLALGILLFITVVICIINKPDPIFLLYTYPIPAVIGGLILMFVRKNNILIAALLLLFSLGYLLFSLIGYPPLTLSGILTDNYFKQFAPETRAFFMSVASARLLLLIGALYMILYNIFSKLKIKWTVVTALFASMIFSLAIPIYSLVSRIPDQPGISQAEQNVIEAVERIDSSHKVLLSCQFPPNENTMKSEFKQGETIYPNSQGLKGGTVYGFRIRGQNGEIIEPLLKEALNTAVDNTWTNGSGAFNTADRPLPPGNYIMELVVVDGKDAFITACTNFTIKNN